MFIRNVATPCRKAFFARNSILTMKQIKITGHQCSKYSTSDQTVKCSLDSKNGVAIITFDNPPVNCLSTKLIQQFNEALQRMEQDPKCTALILASNIPDIFCAGLDFKEIHRPQREQYLNYHRLITKMWTSIYGTRLPTVAAVNGTSPGMGCILPMCCDYRVMKTGKGKIGLPEVHLGISLKSWLAELFVSLVGQRQAELGLSRGLMYHAEDALRIGLVDEVASSEADLLQRATRQAELLAELPCEPRHLAKMLLRQPLLDKFESTRVAAEERIVDAVMNQKQQTDMDVYLEKLKTRKNSTDSN